MQPPREASNRRTRQRSPVDNQPLPPHHPFTSSETATLRSPRPPNVRQSRSIDRSVHGGSDAPAGAAGIRGRRDPGLLNRGHHAPRSTDLPQQEPDASDLEGGDDVDDQTRGGEDRCAGSSRSWSRRTPDNMPVRRSPLTAGAWPGRPSAQPRRRSPPGGGGRTGPQVPDQGWTGPGSSCPWAMCRARAGS